MKSVGEVMGGVWLGDKILCFSLGELKNHVTCPRPYPHEFNEMK